MEHKPPLAARTWPLGGAGHRLRHAAAATVAAIAINAICIPPAASAATAIQPFSEFVKSLSATSADALAARPEAAIESKAAAADMRQHLLTLYHGVSVDHSFAQTEQVFDCVPVNQQPAMQLQALTEVANPPPQSPAVALKTSSPAAPSAKSAGTAAQSESEHCEQGTIPMRRVTLDEMARFPNLQAFFAKGPNDAGHPQLGKPALPRTDKPALAQSAHAYAHAYQWVNNYGGYGALNLWNPAVNTGWPYNEVFSLSQHWYVGYSPTTQTAEVGWQNYPDKYGTHNSVLFIYYTADNYNKTGCYNLECGAFVQTNSNIHVGAGFANYSTLGEAQWEYSVGYYLYQGNWWLAANGQWVGYYPGSLYNGGQLSRYAQVIDFGGETVPGWYYWPPMGSGRFASQGWQWAAYQRQIVYRDSANGGHNPSLTLSQPSPACYTGTNPAWGGADWQTYFYFGGPGGYLGVC